MVRLLLEDVTLAKGTDIAVHVRFKSGQTTSLTLPAPLTALDLRRTPPAVVTEIDRLLDHHTDAGVIAALNDSGITSGTGQAFTVHMIRHLRETYALRTREERLRDQGLVDLEEIAQRLGVCTQTIKRWHHEGRIAGELLNDKGECLYVVPAAAQFKNIGRAPKGGRPGE